eukprot:COSAG01_NODE_7105_length_3352_cov_3.350753_6_plen_100_part_00
MSWLQWQQQQQQQQSCARVRRPGYVASHVVCVGDINTARSGVQLQASSAEVGWRLVLRARDSAAAPGGRNSGIPACLAPPPVESDGAEDEAVRDTVALN